MSHTGSQDGFANAPGAPGTVFAPTFVGLADPRIQIPSLAPQQFHLLKAIRLQKKVRQVIRRETRMFGLHWKNGFVHIDTDRFANGNPIKVDDSENYYLSNQAQEKHMNAPPMTPVTPMPMAMYQHHQQQYEYGQPDYGNYGYDEHEGYGYQQQQEGGYEGGYDGRYDGSYDVQQPVHEACEVPQESGEIQQQEQEQEHSTPQIDGIEIPGPLDMERARTWDVHVPIDPEMQAHLKSINVLYYKASPIAPNPNSPSIHPQHGSITSPKGRGMHAKPRRGRGRGRGPRHMEGGYDYGHHQGGGFQHQHDGGYGHWGGHQGGYGDRYQYDAPAPPSYDQYGQYDEGWRGAQHNFFGHGHNNHHSVAVF
ncbi:unnamed protein product [Vitrella brassicaformis CCMP3155]|uniref:Uncharacterized protein n=1 Tax=Vitrella brassicaformis (strain CCMP3155) TaxID=1169540 RepID=A0A0G4F8M5_VITBC|nr:unnamed protein product [Vitrella brassicaformis CCMP3155]|eukprot:CEM09058.1 unnamed protein product [Vitrella brassicaformis CCMP3155]